MTTSFRQIEANRHNALKSTDPRTENGKQHGALTTGSRRQSDWRQRGAKRRGEPRLLSEQGRRSEARYLLASASGCSPRGSTPCSVRWRLKNADDIGVPLDLAVRSVTAFSASIKVTPVLRPITRSFESACVIAAAARAVAGVP